MQSNLMLLDRIETIRANSVSDEEYREFWGEGLDKHTKDIMDFVREFDAKMESEKFNQPADERQQLAVDLKEDSTENAEIEQLKNEKNMNKGKLDQRIIFLSVSKKIEGSINIIKLKETDNEKKEQTAYEEKILNLLTTLVKTFVDFEIAYRLKESKAKHFSRRMTGIHLLERIRATKEDYTETGIVVIVDFSLLQLEDKEKEELAGRLENIISKDLNQRRIELNDIGNDMPKLEIIFIRRLNKKSKD